MPKERVEISNRVKALLPAIFITALLVIGYYQLWGASDVCWHNVTFCCISALVLYFLSCLILCFIDTNKELKEGIGKKIKSIMTKVKNRTKTITTIIKKKKFTESEKVANVSLVIATISTIRTYWGPDTNATHWYNGAGLFVLIFLVSYFVILQIKKNEVIVNGKIEVRIKKTEGGNNNDTI